MSHRISLVGRTFGKLTVIADAPNIPTEGSRSICTCACGVTKIMTNSNVKRSKSCGCEASKGVPAVHGHARHGYVTPIYRAWQSMRSRCYSLTHPAFADYGGRGITVCDEWVDFQIFMQDMGPRPSGMTLERVNNALGYSKDNCVWKTQKEQTRNQRSNRVFTVRGITACASALAEHFGVPYHRTLMRLKRGWDLERAFFEPSQPCPLVAWQLNKQLQRRQQQPHPQGL